MKRLLFLIAPVLSAFAVFACESATNLDVSYAAPDSATGASDAGAGADADADPDGATGDLLVLEACPCDQAAGLGCCVTPAGAFCTNDLGTCNDAKGAWLRCAKRDYTFESECCWQGSGAGSQTRFASACDGGPTACLTDEDCSGTGQTCKTTTCAGFKFGQCATSPPACP
jgi:hypothetical protein